MGRIMTQRERHNPWNIPYVFLHNGAFLAIVRIRDTRAPTDDAATLVRSVVALVTDPDKRAGTHIRVTDDTLSITYNRMSYSVNQSEFEPLMM